MFFIEIYGIIRNIFIWCFESGEREPMVSRREKIKNKIEELSEEQLNNLSEYIQYHFRVDVVDPQILEAKNRIYNIYKQEIAPLVNKIEVYEHRFPIDAYAGIETIFRYMSSTENLPKDEALLLYKEIERFALNHKTQLAIRVIKLYIKLIKNYRRLLLRFNYTGICPDFKRETKESLKRIRRNLKVGLNLFKKRYKKEKSAIDFSYLIDADVKKEQKALTNALDAAESLMVYCENNYSNIISSGYSSVFFGKLFPVVSIILTVIFSVISALALINLFC